MPNAWQGVCLEEEVCCCLALQGLNPSVCVGVLDQSLNPAYVLTCARKLEQMKARGHAMQRMPLTLPSPVRLWCTHKLRQRQARWTSSCSCPWPGQPLV